MIEDVFHDPVIIALLHDAGQRRHFGHKPVQDLRVVQQAHEFPHGFGRHKPPFLHNFPSRHIIKNAGGGSDNGHPRLRLNGQIKIGGEAQGADRAQIVLRQIKGGNAVQLHATARVEIGKSFVRSAGARRLHVEL